MINRPLREGKHNGSVCRVQTHLQCGHTTSLKFYQALCRSGKASPTHRALVEVSTAYRNQFTSIRCCAHEDCGLFDRQTTRARKFSGTNKSVRNKTSIRVHSSRRVTATVNVGPIPSSSGPCNRRLPGTSASHSLHWPGRVLTGRCICTRHR